MKYLHRYLAIASLGVLCGATPVLAAYPSSVVGTWKGFANQQAVVLTIATQGASGNCRAITGTLSPLASNIQGFYCPDTGRIGFVRKTPATNDSFQVYGGNAAVDSTIDRMSGVFDSVVTPLGEFSWYVTK